MVFTKTKAKNWRRFWGEQKILKRGLKTKLPASS
jgi:hypothetical protein